MKINEKSFNCEVYNSQVLDDAYIHAVENDEGVDEDGRIVTSEMLKYSGS